MSDSADIAPSPFDDHIGTQFGELGAERATARLEVEARHLQPFGIVHGGIYCALAESVTSRASGLALAAEGKQALGMTNQTQFMRPVTDGAIEVEATRRHGGRTTWVWDVEMRDGGGRLCALTRITLAVREIRD